MQSQVIKVALMFWMLSILPGLGTVLGIPGFNTFLLIDELGLVIFFVLMWQRMQWGFSKSGGFLVGAVYGFVGACLTQILLHTPPSINTRLAQIKALHQPRLFVTALHLSLGWPFTLIHILTGTMVFGILGLILSSLATRRRKHSDHRDI